MTTTPARFCVACGKAQKERKKDSERGGENRGQRLYERAKDNTMP
jgi:NADH pyrophosphatase NudC (nudix superfamily)